MSCEDLTYRNVDEDIVKKCDECRLLMKRWCKVWFDARNILECLEAYSKQNEFMQKLLEQKPTTVSIQNLYRCYDNPYYYIHIYCEMEYIRVRFYEGDKYDDRWLLYRGGVIKNLICEWEVNDTLTYELITTLQYRVNSYLIESRFNHNFYPNIEWYLLMPLL